MILSLWQLERAIAIPATSRCAAAGTGQRRGIAATRHLDQHGAIRIQCLADRGKSQGRQPASRGVAFCLELAFGVTESTNPGQLGAQSFGRGTNGGQLPRRDPLLNLSGAVVTDDCQCRRFAAAARFRYLPGVEVGSSGIDERIVPLAPYEHEADILD